MLIGLALCSTVAMAQTINRAELRADRKLNIQPKQKAIVDYKASIFTKEDDTVRVFTFADNDLEGVLYGAQYTLGANDIINGTAVGTAAAHGQTRTSSTWNRIPNYAYVTGTAFQQNYPQLSDLGVIDYNKEALDSIDNGFMLMAMMESGTSAGAFNAYIEFPAVANNGYDVIDISLSQLYYKFNNDMCFVDYRLDDGTWNSREINVRGIDCESNEWATLYPSYTMPFEICDQNDIKIRIRWACNNSIGSAYGYFWAIDNVAIVVGDATRLKRYDQVYIDGAYGIMPQGMRIPLSWYAQVANTGRNNISNANINVFHGLVGDEESTSQIATYEQNTTYPQGDPTALFYTSINERNFLDSLETYWLTGYGWNLGNTYGSDYVPQNYVGLPVEQPGLQYIQTSISSDDIDSIYWPYRLYQVADESYAAQGSSLSGYRWAHDNGLLTNYRTGFHYGIEAHDEGYINIEDTNHYQSQGYMVTLRYTTGSEIPTDGNGEPWVLLGMEIIPSTTEIDMNYMNNSEIFPVIYKPGFDEDGDLYTISEVNTGFSATRPYVVNVETDANNEDIQETFYMTPDMDYNAVTIRFPAQPVLEPNTSYYLGYEMANDGFFCPATVSNYYRDETNETMYIGDDPSLRPYLYHFTPNAMDFLCFDPASGYNYLLPYSGRSISSYPMIRAIVGPRAQLEQYQIQANCQTGDNEPMFEIDANYNGEFQSICDQPDGSFVYNEGESVVVYVIPSDDEHFMVDSIIINGVSYSPEAPESWPSDLYIDAREYHVMSPADTTQIALWRYYYVLYFEDIHEDKIISAVAHNEPWHIGIDPVDANVALGVQPNPATSYVNVNMTGVTGMVNCSIIDMSGRTVYSKDIDAEQTHTIDLADFARGAYFLRVTNNSFSKIEKFIVR